MDVLIVYNLSEQVHKFKYPVNELKHPLIYLIPRYYQFTFHVRLSAFSASISHEEPSKDARLSRNRKMIFHDAENFIIISFSSAFIA